VKWLAAVAVALLGLLSLVGLLVLTPAGPLLRDGVGLAREAVPAAYAGAIEAAAASCDGVSAPVLAAQLRQESGWRVDAVSSVGAIGMAQFMPATWAAHGIDGDGDGRADPRNAYDAIWSAAGFNCVLKSQVARVPGDIVALTLAAYNAGPYAVLQHRGIPPYAETQGYVRAILEFLPTFTKVLGGAMDGLTPRAANVRQVVLDTFGVTDIGGFATDGHAPGSDHYTGRAIDVMLTPLGPANTALGWQIAAYLQSNAQVLGIKYLIWDGRIWSPERAGQGWRPYRHPSGRSSPTLDHLDHVHVSVR
jgi:hypothetical protein